MGTHDLTAGKAVYSPQARDGLTREPTFPTAVFEEFTRCRLVALKSLNSSTPLTPTPSRPCASTHAAVWSLIVRVVLEVISDEEAALEITANQFQWFVSIGPGYIYKSHVTTQLNNTGAFALEVLCVRSVKLLLMMLTWTSWHQSKHWSGLQSRPLGGTAEFHLMLK